MIGFMGLSGTLAPLVDLILPPRCPLCGAGLSQQVGLCAGCWQELVIPGQPACRSCQRPFDATIEDGAVCAPCLADPPDHDGIAAATLYNDASRKLVLAFKHGHRIALAPMLARLMSTKLERVGPDWLIIPVPLHRWRLWQRGFNQAGLLGREIARMKDAQLLVDALCRKKRTPSLGGLGRKARERALSGTIGVNAHCAGHLKGARIVLVDDVFTSGATSNACVRALKRAGAIEVVIACFARVLDEALPSARLEPAIAVSQATNLR